MALVYGVGVREDGKYQVTEGSKHTKLYTLWKNMLARCYSKTMLMHRPTYEKCEVRGDFTHFQKFGAWHEASALDTSLDYQLDKDLLVKGNKVYSEEFCLLVPRQVNMFLCKSEAVRGDYPIGVTYNKRDGVFRAQVSDRGTKTHSDHRSVEEAFEWYKTEKEVIAKRLARDFDGKCDARVIDALLNYKVEITD